jgi:hypothetical protein
MAAPPHTPHPQIYTVTRDGQRPLRFTGTVLACVEGVPLYGPERAYSLRVYRRLPDEAIVVQWAYRTQAPGESPHARVGVFAWLEEALHALDAFDPVAWVVGYRLPQVRPAVLEPHYEARHALLAQQIRDHYASQVAEVYVQLGFQERLGSPGGTPHAAPTGRWVVLIESVVKVLACIDEQADYDPALRDALTALRQAVRQFADGA